MAVGPRLTGALEEAIQGHKDLQEKWIKVLARLAGHYGAMGTLQYQSDYRIDLLLRSLEAELATALPAENLGQIFAFDMQHALTRYWVLSTYEALRIARWSETGKSDAKLQTLHDRFKIVRIPLAKSEIANDRLLRDGQVMLGRVGEGEPVPPEEYRSRQRFPDEAREGANAAYIPVVFIDQATGSIGWEVIDAAAMKPVAIKRQELSDELVALFD